MKKIYEDIKKVFDSKTATTALIVVGMIIVALLIFSLGMSVGFHKASFGRAWGENYERNFGMMPSRQMFGRDNFPNAHGATGKIIKITLPTIIVQDRDNTEKVILIKDDTQIQEMKNSILPKDLKKDSFVVVIGDPNAQGQIEAKLIRIMPLGMPVLPPPQTPTVTQ